jgi:hypothetical protein
MDSINDQLINLFRYTHERLREQMEREQEEINAVVREWQRRKEEKEK